MYQKHQRVEVVRAMPTVSVTERPDNMDAVSTRRNFLGSSTAQYYLVIWAVHRGP